MSFEREELAKLRSLNVAELREYRREVAEYVDEVQSRVRNGRATQEDLANMREVRDDIRVIDKRYDELVREAARNPRAVERGDQTYEVPGRDSDGRDSDSARSSALRAIDRNAHALDADAGDRLDRLVREHDRHGQGARYLSAVANENYLSAFSKILADPQHASYKFTPAESGAVREVAEAEAERALSIGSPPAGMGLAVPFTIDPSIVISGTGSQNPLRQISRVELISTNEWHGITADQVTAPYQAEATEVADASPTPIQPTVTTRRGTAFVPISMEIAMDVPTLTADLGRVLSDARDNLDAQVFLTGTVSSNQPVGILNIGVTGGLGTGQRIQTATVGTYALADAWSLKAAIPPRFIGKTSTIMHPKTLDTTYRFVGGGSTEPPVMYKRDDGIVYGRPVYEMSTLATPTTTGDKILVSGDFGTGHLIVDRLGFQIEVVPHLFGASNRFPTGQRGVLAIWRSGASVVTPNALRYLEVK
jgi:HK97 family phage major capsid protein